MKKVFMMAIMAIVAISASAQAYVGGSIGFTNVKVDGHDDSQNTLTIAPEVGYTLSDDWAIGAALGFTYYKEGDASVTAFEVSPYVRYTAIHADRVNFFLDGVVNFNTAKPKGGDAQNGWGIGIKPGVAFKVNDNVSLVAHVGFLGYEDSHKIDGKKKFGIGLDGNDFSLGFYYNF